MGYAELNGKLGIQFEMDLEAVLQTCNHSLRIFPFDEPLLGYQEALLSPQVPVVLCPSAEHVLIPVCVTIIRITDLPILCDVCTNYMCILASFSGQD